MIPIIGLILILCRFSNSHILMPPFLPSAYLNNYFEQKMRIPKLETAQFKISGLPSGIFWTSNGTIFGTPSILGEWKILIRYDSLTQSGTYQTFMRIKDQVLNKQYQAPINQSLSSFQIIFPQNILIIKGKTEQIQIQSKNGKNPITWKFITLPKGAKPIKDGKLEVNIQNQGLYIIRFQAKDSNNNQLQGCLTLNIQASPSNFSEIYAANTIYEPNNILNNLLQTRNKVSQITKQLFEAAKNVGEQSAVLKQTQESFSKIQNNLIQLQSQAKKVQGKLQGSFREKSVQQDSLKQAMRILENAQGNLNLVLIQQSANNYMLQDSRVQKQKAQDAYKTSSLQLSSQTLLTTTLQKSTLTSRQQKQTTAQTLLQFKTSYDFIAKQILIKQKQIASSNANLLKIKEQARSSELQIRLQQHLVSQEETQRAVIYNNVNIAQNRNKEIARAVETLRRQRQFISSDMISLDKQLNQIKRKLLLQLQNSIKDVNMRFQDHLVKAAELFNQASFNSDFLQRKLKTVMFQGCSSAQYPTLQGVFKISQGSILEQYYKSQNGQKILFGNCTRMPNLKPGDQIIFLGYTAHGVLHADIIAPY